MDYVSRSKQKENPRVFAQLHPARRRKIYALLQQIEHEEAPHLVLVEPEYFRLQRDWVRGYVYNPVFPESPNSSYYYSQWKE